MHLGDGAAAFDPCLAIFVEVVLCFVIIGNTGEKHCVTIDKLLTLIKGLRSTVIEIHSCLPSHATFKTYIVGANMSIEGVRIIDTELWFLFRGGQVDQETWLLMELVDSDVRYTIFIEGTSKTVEKRYQEELDHFYYHFENDLIIVLNYR